MRETPMPSGWTEAPLGELFDVLDHQRVPVNVAERTARLAATTARYPYYGATGQVGEIDDYLFDGESVLLGEDGAPFLDPRRRKAYLVSGRHWVNNHAHILRAKGPHSNAFLCHQLNAISYAKHVSGTTRLKLTQGAMREISLRVAPPHEQQRIASKIDELFSEIEEGERALERVQKLVERYRQSVLKAAVTGELTREWREKHKGPLESGEALLQRILKVRREAWEKAELAKMKAKAQSTANGTPTGRYTAPIGADATELPELPNGWVWASMDQVGFVSGGLTKNQKRSDHALQRPYLRVANVYANRLELGDVQEIGVSEAELERVLLKADDLLVVEGNGSIEQIGRVALWDGSIPGCVHQNHIIKVRSAKVLPSWYLLVWCMSPLGREQIRRVASSTAGLHTLSISKVQALPVPVPPAEELAIMKDAFEQMDSGVDAQRVAVRAENKRAAALRQSVLKQAFVGGLVSQDPSDEPASVLLARVAADPQPTPARRLGGAARSADTRRRKRDILV